MKVMYLDEAGNHALNTVESNFPVFVLGGVILDRQYVFEIVGPRLSALKTEFFGRDDFVLHTAELVRTKGPFSTLKDSSRKEAFIGALTELMRDLEYTVVACAIDKVAFREVAGYTMEDLYPRSLEYVIHQFCLEVGEEVGGGLVYAERRRSELDFELEATWDALRWSGTERLSADDISSRVLELVLKDKRTRNPGLELADLVVSPIGRAIAGYAKREDWNVIESKFRRVNGIYAGAGLVVLPE